MKISNIIKEVLSKLKDPTLKAKFENISLDNMLYMLQEEAAEQYGLALEEFAKGNKTRSSIHAMNELDCWGAIQVLEHYGI